MKNPKISVIIPYYNAERWLKRCADSLTSQEGDFEFIFVNDGSEDGSEEIINGIKDDRIKRVRLNENSGVSAARNAGLLFAKGEWITFLDADDEMLPDAMWKFKTAMEKADADIYQFNHVRHYPKQDLTQDKWHNPPGMHELNDLPRCWFGVWNKLYRAKLVLGLQFDEEMQYGEDELFNLECLAEARRIYTSDATTVQHNVENDNSLSRTRRDIDLIKEIQKLGDFVILHEDRGIRRVAYDLMTVHTATKWEWDVICG